MSENKWDITPGSKHGPEKLPDEIIIPSTGEWEGGNKQEFDQMAARWREGTDAWKRALYNWLEQEKRQQGSLFYMMKWIEDQLDANNDNPALVIFATAAMVAVGEYITEYGAENR